MEESSQREKRKTAGKNGENVRRAERKERRDLVRESGARERGDGERELREVRGTRGGGRWERNAFGFRRRDLDVAVREKKKNGRKTTKSDEDDDDDDDDDEDDDTTYNVHRDGSERSKSEKKRAKEEWAMQIDLDVDRTFRE